MLRNVLRRIQRRRPATADTRIPAVRLDTLTGRARGIRVRPDDLLPVGARTWAAGPVDGIPCGTGPADWYRHKADALGLYRVERAAAPRCLVDAAREAARAAEGGAR